MHVDTEDLAEGDGSPRAAFGPITQADVVRYAGEGGDLAAIHYDRELVALAGIPAPFVMGMLPAGFLARVLSAWIAHRPSYRLRLRFASSVLIGDTIECVASVVARGVDSVRVDAPRPLGTRSWSLSKLTVPL